MLSVMLEACQPFFNFFPKFTLKDLNRGDFSRQLVAILVSRANVTMLLPVWRTLARYSQEKSAHLSGRANKVKEKMHDQRTRLFQGIFDPRNTRMMRNQASDAANRKLPPPDRRPYFLP